MVASVWLALAPTSGGAQELNSWPFPGVGDADVRDYVDERATMVAINRMTGRMLITLDGGGSGARRVEVPLAAVDPHDREILPVNRVFASRAEAERAMPRYEPYREYGVVPVLLYRDAGIVWPTAINPQTAPRIMAVYQRAMDAARAGDRATRDAFVDTALWYMGARLPMGAGKSGIKPGAKPAAPAAGAVPETRAVTSAAAATAAGSVWALPPAQRGLAVERALGANLGKTFPVIDRFENGVATSIKSLDLNAKSYQDAQQVTSTVKGYIDKVAKFTGDTRAGVIVREADITSRAVDLAVPSLGTPAQRAALESLVAYGQSSKVANKVIVNIIVFP